MLALSSVVALLAAMRPRRQSAPAPARDSATVNGSAAAGRAETPFEQHVRQGGAGTSAAPWIRELPRLHPIVRTEWSREAGTDDAIPSLVTVMPPSGGHSGEIEGRVVSVARDCLADEGRRGWLTAVARNGENAHSGEVMVMTLANGTKVMLVPFNGACVAVTVLQGIA